jgi:leucyl aminopeptidase
MSTSAIRPFEPAPSLRRSVPVAVMRDLPTASEAGALAVPVLAGSEPPPELGHDVAALAAAGFEAKRGETLVIPQAEGPTLVALGIGSPSVVDAALVRDLAGDFARAVPQHKRLAVEVPDSDQALGAAEFAQAVTEGVLLARWRFFVGAGGDEPTLDSLAIVASDAHADEVAEGIRRGRATAAAASLSRDLANCPAATLTATRMAEVAEEAGAARPSSSSLVAAGCSE